MKATKTNIKTNKLSNKGIVKADIALINHTFKVLTEAEVNHNRSISVHYILMNYYSFSFIHRTYDYDEKLYYLLFKFKSTILNQVYLVSLYEYPNNIYIAKFYLKSERFSPNKYTNTTFGKHSHLNISSSDYVKNFFLVMNTILQIAIRISEDNKSASFGFLGAHKDDERDKMNSDNTFSNTKRYLV